MNEGKEMRIRIGDKEFNVRAVWLEDEERAIIKMIDQRYIPWRLEFYESGNIRDTFYAIKNFVVRGAPTIGATAALGMYQVVLEAIRVSDFKKKLEEGVKYLSEARPTAHNLFHAINKVKKYAMNCFDKGIRGDKLRIYVKEFIDDYIEKSLECNRKIGEFGEKIIKNGARVLTHCNAGALAAVDIGTATAPIYYAHERGKNVTVFVTETRPWLQGARITAWEVQQQGIDVCVITDNAAGYLMWKGEIDIVIVGADRIAMNGDTANKIGTYKLALAARDNGIPFYVAAPTSTIDPNARSGKDILIEERSEREVHYVRGVMENGEIGEVRITPPNVRARNPVFDITPSRLITGFITEKGIIRHDEIHKIIL